MASIRYDFCLSRETEAGGGRVGSDPSKLMPASGGAGTWFGPVIGAVLLASLQQAATVTISSAANLMIVGVVLVVFAAAAPRGIVGLIRGGRHR